MSNLSRRRKNRPLELAQIRAFIGRFRVKTITLSDERRERLRDSFDAIMAENINRQLRDDQLQYEARRDAFQKTVIVRKGVGSNTQERL